MYRKIFLFSICLAESIAIPNIFSQFLERTNMNVTRVRTLQQRDRSWETFTVLDFIGLVEQYKGYKAEEYRVLTNDGYVLVLHRICASPYSLRAQGKSVVYIQHGLFGSSDFFVTLEPKQSLAFQLADAGYDVWLGNVRGNTYSKRHIIYPAAGNSFKFWNFSMDEMATIDLPTFIDTILKLTNKRQLTYIGYSMGTTIGTIFLSAKPEYNSKINLVVNIAPVVFFTRPLSPRLKAIMMILPRAKKFVLANHIYEVLPQSKLTQIVSKDICASDMGKLFCGGFLNGVAKHLNHSALPLLISHTPAGTSVNTIDHYYQMIVTGKFGKYNPEFDKNLKQFHREPVIVEYDLSKITAPQAMFYAESDIFMNKKGATKLRNRLKNVVAFEKIPEDLNHLDFVWAYDVKYVINNKILKIMSAYSY